MGCPLVEKVKNLLPSLSSYFLIFAQLGAVRGQKWEAKLLQPSIPHPLQNLHRHRYHIKLPAPASTSSHLLG